MYKRQKYVYAMHRAGRDLAAYAEAGPRDATFTQLANLLAGERKAYQLEALLAAHRPHAGDTADMHFYGALAKLLRKQPAEAAALLRKAYDKQADEPQRAAYVRRFVQEMQQLGQPLEGYRAAPDKSVAFQMLAPGLTSEKKEKELAALLEEHGKGHAKELLYEFYMAELLLMRGEVGRAEKRFAECLAKAPPAEQWRCRNGLFRARVQAGNAVPAYLDAGSDVGTFETLARLCAEAKDGKQLGALLDSHRRAHPDDPGLTAWDLEVRWLGQDYEGALKLLAEQREFFALPRYKWKADDYRVRCLVRLKRTAEAVKEAEAVAKAKYGNRMPLALAHAAAGNVKEAVAALSEPPPAAYFLRTCYQDPDLGPLLRGEAFREFREKYPEPKDEEP